MPNLPVDMDSWERSACYPRRTFYQMSNGPSTRDRWIINTDFRLCSTFVSRSQAPLCVYTQLTIANRDEGTIALLRYSLGGDRPSQTARLTLSCVRLYGTQLEFLSIKAGIPTTAPLGPKSKPQSLPAILRIMNKNPISAYSKGARGLSV